MKDTWNVLKSVGNNLFRSTCITSNSHRSHLCCSFCGTLSLLWYGWGPQGFACSKDWPAGKKYNNNCKFHTKMIYRQIVEFTLCLPIMARDVSLFSLIVYSLSSVHSLLSSTQLYTRLKPMFLWAVVLANNFQLPALTHSSVCICTKKHMAKWHWKYIWYNSIYNVQIGYTLHKVNMEFDTKASQQSFFFLASFWLIVFRLRKSFLGWRYHTKTTTPSIAISKVSSSHFSSEDPWALKLIFTFLSLHRFCCPTKIPRTNRKIWRFPFPTQMQPMAQCQYILVSFFAQLSNFFSCSILL